MDCGDEHPLPLAGITVLELGMVLAGPFAGSLLADLGATVIKIEPPGTGDAARQMGPRKDGVALWWGVASRGKKCITLNLKDGAACDLFERLVATADVLVENFRPGVLDRLGLGWERLSAINPRLVMLSITGFGQTGPGAERPGFGKIAEGMSGLVWLTGDPDQNPLFVGYSLADTTAGLFGVYSVNLALYRRDVQGCGGAHIDLALYEPMLRMMEPQFAMRRALGRAPVRTGSNDPHGWGRTEPRDVSFHFVQASGGEWLELEIPEGAKPDVGRRLEINGAAGTDSLPTALAEWARSRSPHDVRQLLQAAGAKVVPVLDGRTIAELDYCRMRGDVLPAFDPAVGHFHVTGFFPRHYRRPEGTRTFDGPGLGAHNREILVERLGLTEGALDELKRRGAV
jgi:crotonobetainyl-CoA:carnitine CoA-transferase CaiB-like acyl-CoA transferase